MKKGHIEGRKCIIATEKGTYMAEKKRSLSNPLDPPGKGQESRSTPPRPPVLTPQVIMDVRM